MSLRYLNESDRRDVDNRLKDVGGNSEGLVEADVQHRAGGPVLPSKRNGYGDLDAPRRGHLVGHSRLEVDDFSLKGRNG